MYYAKQIGTGEESPSFVSEGEAKEWGEDHYNAFEVRNRVEPMEVKMPVEWKDRGLAKRVMNKIIWGNSEGRMKHWEINEIKDCKLDRRIIV